AHRGKSGILPAKPFGDPTDQMVELIFTMKWPELLPVAKAKWYFVSRNIMQKGQADPSIITFRFIQRLAKEIGLDSGTEANPDRSSLVILRKPSFRSNDQNARRIIRVALAPLPPAQIRTARVFLKVELV